MRFTHRFALAAVAATLALGLLASPAALAQKDKDEEPDILFVPTDMKVVAKMLEVAKVGSKDVVYDLGCGDGRIVCMAAEKYKAKAFGFDVDSRRIKDSEENKAKLDKEIQKLVTFEKKNVFTLDLSDVNVVTLYLLPSLNVKLIPQLKKLKAGSRIVSHDFDMRGVTPDEGFPIRVKGEKRDHTVYRWTTPLKIEKE